MDLTRDVNSDPRRVLPSVDRLSRQLRGQRPDLPRWAVTEGARRVVAEARARLAPSVTGAPPTSLPSPEGQDATDWLQRAAAEAEQLAMPHPRRVINATGVVLHTNLGRAPMAPGAAAAAAAAAVGYSNLEFDVATGRRGNRLGSLEHKLQLLSGSEAALACNNNAAAVFLALNTLAAGREVIVSRGELVEIGGSFRVPEIMRRAGVKLVEIGSTNRTHARDYEQAIGPDTALLLKVHRSNFELKGFVKEVELQELVEIGRTRGVPVMEDLGSATLIDLQDHGFPPESFAPARVRLGPDLVCFSGDKLMGGPQAGIALGRQELVAAMRSNPLARALRLDKMTLAALDWTLSRLLEGDAARDLPIIRQLLMPIDELEARTRSLAERLEALAAAGSPGVKFRLERDRVPVGGGSLPGFELETVVLSLRHSRSAGELAMRLRTATVPVLSRTRDEAVLLDLRTVQDDEVDSIVQAVSESLR